MICFFLCVCSASPLGAVKMFQLSALKVVSDNKSGLGDTLEGEN